jgi:hypothetical protein
MRRFCAALVFFLLAAGFLMADGYFMTPAFEKGEGRPLRLLLLPPHAQFIKAKVVMTDDMVKECRALEDEAAAALAAGLRAKGYEVKVLTPEEVQGGADLAELVRKVHERFAEERSKIFREPAKVETGRYRLGEEAGQLAALNGVDGLVLARIQAEGVSKGTQTFWGTLVLLSGGLFIPMPGSIAFLDMSVVDAYSGKIEGFFYGLERCGIRQLVQRPEKAMGDVTHDALKKYPEAAEAATQARKEVEALHRQDEEAIVKELEALVQASGAEEAKKTAEEKSTGGTSEKETQENKEP